MLSTHLKINLAMSCLLDVERFAQVLENVPWKRKCCDNVVNINSIDGNTDDLTIADIFKKKFNTHASSGNNSSETGDYMVLCHWTI